MTTPARDLFDLEGSPQADLHVFGGDFDEEHGVKKIRKFERIRNVMRLFDSDLPDIFIGQLVKWEGEKVSKSGKRFWPYFDWTDISERHEFLERGVECVTEKAKGKPVVDYSSGE